MESHSVDRMKWPMQMSPLMNNVQHLNMRNVRPNAKSIYAIVITDECVE